MKESLKLFGTFETTDSAEISNWASICTTDLGYEHLIASTVPSRIMASFLLSLDYLNISCHMMYFVALHFHLGSFLFDLLH